MWLFLSCLAGLYISPTMNVLPSLEVFEGDILEVVCKVISPLKNTEVFLTKDRRILKQAAVSLNHRFTAKEGDSGELVCKAEWGNVQKETYKTITVKGKNYYPLVLSQVSLYSKLKKIYHTCTVSCLTFNVQLQQSCFQSPTWLWRP